jgi:2,3-bisphosphoglycerate-dependent phosphoglycerate mutase
MLIMKNIFVLLGLVFAIVSCQKVEKTPEDHSITTIYLIRHAEKDRSDKENRDPELTEEGKQRAERWAEVFGLSKMDAVYSTNYQRTLQTAAPTAMRNGLEIQTYEPNNLNIDSIATIHKGERILIVGHSNTTPMLVNRALGEERFEWIEDTVNGNLFVLTITPSAKGVQVLSIE